MSDVLSAAEIAGDLTPTLRLALDDIRGYDRMGYVWNWKQKSREKLQAMGLVTPLVEEWRMGHNMKVCRLTDLGRSVAATLTADRSRLPTRETQPLK